MTQSPIAALERVAGQRVSVMRVLECLRGDREPRQVKPGDWLSSLEYVRDDLDLDLALLYEVEMDDAPNSICAFRVGRFGRVEQKAWNDVLHSGAPVGWRVWDRREAIETIRHSRPEIVPLDSVDERIMQFAARAAASGGEA